MLTDAVGRAMRGSWKGGWYGGLALAALCLVIVLPGFFIMPVVDRDEARFAQASRQMLESVALPDAQRDPVLHGGGLVVPMLGAEARLNKPPLIYWLQAASAWVLTGGDPMRDAIWMYRVPSAVAFIVIVLMTWRLGIEMFGWPTGFLAGCMMAVSPVFMWEAHQARADMVLVAVTCVAMWGVWGVWKKARRHDGTEARSGERKRRRDEETKRRSGGAWLRVCAVWVGVGLGVLVKGPITPMVVGLAVVMLCLYARSWRWVWGLKPIVGICVVVAMAAPWVWLVGDKVGWGEYARVVIGETLGRGAASREGHWGPPGYHLVLMVVLLWPGSMLTGLAFGTAVRRGLVRARHGGTKARRHEGRQSRGRRVWEWVADRKIGRPAEAFCVAWIVPSWIVFELVATKLPHYTMPLYPAVALISARAVHWAVSGAMPGAFSRAQRLGFVLWCSFPAIVSIACLVLGVLKRDDPIGVTLIVFGLVSLFTAVSLIRPVRSRRLLRAMRIGLAYGAILGVVMIEMVIAREPYIWPTQELMTEIERIDPARKRPVAIVGYSEDSIRLAFRGRPNDLTLERAIGWVNAHPRGLLVTRANEVPDALGSLAPVGRVKGFNFGAGDDVSLTIWARHE
jgi:4-amino-4-deoxy-L-arabinose transferase-like glycosyltransferase